MESALSSFYELTATQTQLLRARRAEVARTISECDAARFVVWVFCVWCGNARMMEPRFLVAQIKDPPNLLEQLEKRLCCEKCRRHGVRLIPTDRTSVSFDRMGGAVRD